MAEAVSRDIQVHKEETFPLEDMANDPVAQQSAAEMNLSAEQLRDLGGSILSISVSAGKPKANAASFDPGLHSGRNGCI